ncbi:MAG: hypothetical protein IPK64_02575 [bacterium]|nr:hypothetical protein [bacterium]
MIPVPWDDAGSAPHDNITGLDPGLRDPDHGDFRATNAAGYGSRIVPAAAALAPPAAAATAAGQPAAGRPATLTVAGDITVDTLWDAATVLVTSAVTIRDGAVLTVAPGVAVAFTGHHGLVVRDGALQVHGTASAPVDWSSLGVAGFTATPDTSGSWSGISFLNVPASAPASFLRSCIFRHAKAVPGFGVDQRAPRVGGVCTDGDGGALRFTGPGAVEVSGCVLHDNAADRGGALSAHYGAAPVIVNCLLHDNVAWSRAGAVYVTHAYPRLVHTTIIDNSVANPDLYFRTAGGSDHVQARPRYVGCILHGNTTHHHDAFQLLEPRAIHVHHCNVQGYGLGQGGLDLDPRFAATAGRPGLLGPDSPCLDAGDLAAAAAWLPATDLTGRPRLVGAQVDLGCCERQASVAPAPLPAWSAPAVTAHPNPANPGTTIRWRADTSGPVRVAVHDLGGRLVRVLVDGLRPAGPAAAHWDGRDDAGARVAAGAYVARVGIAHKTATVKVTLLP